MGRRGGARKGAGRKKGWRKKKGWVPRTPVAPESSAIPTASTASGEPAAAVPPVAQPVKLYQSAEEYLEAVVTGEAEPDRDRIAAAKAMLPYQIAKRRLPIKADAPRQMELSRDLEQEKEHLEEWERTQAVVRLKVVGGRQQ